MARLFPFRSESTEVSQEPRLVNLDDTTADEVFAALSSDTARAILSRLYEEPATASDVADAVDTSLQNARYHLDKLQDAGLIEDVDTWYSSRGTEMTVYAPTNEPLVVAAGREESTGVLRDALKRVLGSVGVLALASVLVDRLARTTNLAGSERYTAADGGVDDTSGGDGGGANLSFTDGTEAYEAATETPSATAAPSSVPEDDAEVGVFDAPAAGSTETPQPAMDTPTAAATETPMEDAATRTVEATREVERTTDAIAGGATSGPTPTPDPAPAATATEAGTPTLANVTLVDGGGLADAAGSLPPGLLFFAGGLLMIALGAGWWYAGRYRRGRA